MRSWSFSGDGAGAAAGRRPRAEVPAPAPECPPAGPPTPELPDPEEPSVPPAPEEPAMPADPTPPPQVPEPSGPEVEPGPDPQPADARDRGLAAAERGSAMASAMVSEDATPRSVDRRDAVWRCAPGFGGIAADRLAGYSVEVSDGSLGTVALAREDAGGAYLIVLCAPAAGGARTAMVPAGLVRRVEHRQARVELACSREDVRSAPPYENDRYQDAAYRSELARHYAPRLRAGRGGVRTPRVRRAAVLTLGPAPAGSLTA